MKKSLFVVAAFVLFAFTKCKKAEGVACTDGDRNVIASAAEIASVNNYITNAMLTGYTQHSSGFFFKVVTPGTTAPGLCSKISVAYTGKLTNGNTFDQSTNASFTLGGTIEGWRKGIPQVGKGGRVNLIIPPTLGYGAQEVRDRNAVVIIPSNSILVFDVTINDVQ